MNTLQYEYIINNNHIEKEEGHFFKAGTFSIVVNNTTYTVTFKKKEETVVYSITDGNSTIVELIHPDYVPNCSIEDLNSTFNNPDMQTIFIALCKHGVAIEKDYLKWIDAHQETLSVSYKLIQDEFIS